MLFKTKIANYASFIEKNTRRIDLVVMDGYTLSFEDWCTVSTRVFGSSSINEIGEKN